MTDRSDTLPEGETHPAFVFQRNGEDEIEELLAALHRPSTAEELFGGSTVNSRKQQDIEARIREWVRRHSPNAN